MDSPANQGQPSEPVTGPVGDALAGDAVAADSPNGPQLAKWLLIYTAIRIGMLVVLAALLSLAMPLILALLFAVILALPLSWLLFGGVRRRVNEAMAVSTVHRRAERERLRSALDGRDEL